MDLLETVHQFFVLLFWYIDERNWSVQSTSSIVKPRKEPEEYKSGDMVVAKFQGKPYRAVIISVKDQKEKLDEDKKKLDGFLQVPNLSPEEILERMGLKGSLDYGTKDATDLGSRKNELSQPKKRASADGARKSKKAKESKDEPTSKPVSALKNEDRKQKKAALDAARLVASGLLKNNVPDYVNKVQFDVAVSTHLFPTQTANTNCSVTEDKQSPTLPHAQMQTSDSIGNTLSQALTTVTPALTPPVLTSPLHLQQNTSNISDLHLTNHLSATPFEFTQQLNSAFAGDWGYQESSASECLANSLSSYEPVQPEQPIFDCSKCMPLINSLTNRVQVLEQQVESLLKSSMTNNCNQPLHSSQTAQMQQPLSTNIQQSQPVLMPQSSGSIDDQNQAGSSAGAGGSCWSEADAGCNTRNEIDLVPGYGVKISIPQLDACVRKSKGSGTALARLLCDVFFTDDIMARSCVRGSKARTALDSTIIGAIIRFVQEKRSTSEKDIVQAINQKCTDVRNKQCTKITGKK